MWCSDHKYSNFFAQSCFCEKIQHYFTILLFLDAFGLLLWIFLFIQYIFEHESRNYSCTVKFLRKELTMLVLDAFELLLFISVPFEIYYDEWLFIIVKEFELSGLTFLSVYCIQNCCSLRPPSSIQANASLNSTFCLLIVNHIWALFKETSQNISYYIRWSFVVFIVFKIVVVWDRIRLFRQMPPWTLLFRLLIVNHIWALFKEGYNFSINS